MAEVPQYLIGFACLGLALSLVSFLQIYTERIKITYILPLLLLGALLYWLEVPLPWPDPLWNFKFAKIITEVVIIISIMTAGLKIGVRYNWEQWKRPLSLIVLTMPLFMVGIYLIAYYWLQLNGPVSLLLAAILAPTDPVLASEVQLETNQKPGHKNTGFRYILTAEAGINDGLAFPFVFLAILWSKASNFSQIDWVEYLSFYVGYKIITGLIIGMLLGVIFSKGLYAQSVKNQNRLLKSFLAVTLTFASYGIAEIVSAYGFLSVFATGLFLQWYKPKSKKPKNDDAIINFVEEVEKLMVTVWTMFFGGSVISGILSYTDWKGVLFSLIIVLILRPITGYIGLLKLKESRTKRVAIAFYGIRGIGSFYYLSYALLKGKFHMYDQLFGIVSYTVLFSILIHGLTSLHTLDYLKRKYGE